MALDQTLIKVFSRRSEVRTEKQFQNIGFKVIRLDRTNPRPRPDFLVSDSSGPMLIAEVKTIFSGGYLKEETAHISTLDPGFLDIGMYGHEVSLSNIDEALSYATGQYRSLIEDLPEYHGLPLVVVLFFDFFADHFRLYPRRMTDFPEVSGLVRLEEDRLIREKARKMPTDELRNRIESGSMKGFPPNTKEFRLLQNDCAATPLPAHFVMACLES